MVVLTPSHCVFPVKIRLSGAPVHMGTGFLKATGVLDFFLTKFDKYFVYRADDEDDYVPDNRYSRGGGAEKVILPTAPRASLGSAIDSDRIPNVSIIGSEAPSLKHLGKFIYYCMSELSSNRIKIGPG